MSDNTPYSGTGEFPAVPGSATPEREPFAMQPTFPEALCPALNVDTDVVPPLKSAPSFDPPRVKPLVKVSQCEASPPLPDCIPFVPNSVFSVDVNGRKFIGNNLSDRPSCTLASYTHLELNTTPYWRIESNPPTERDVRITKSVAIHSGFTARKYRSRRLVKWIHFPSGRTGIVSGLSKVRKRLPGGPTARTDYPIPTDLVDFWAQQRITGPAGVAGATHPMFTPGNYPGYGQMLPVDANAWDADEYKVISLPAVTTEHSGELLQSLVDDVVLPQYIYWHGGELWSTPNVGDLHSAFDNSDLGSQLLGYVDTTGCVVQLQAGPVEEMVPDEYFTVLRWGGKVLIYLPASVDGVDVALWVRNNTKPTLNTGALTPATYFEDGWYELGDIGSVTGYVIASISGAAPNTATDISGYTLNITVTATAPEADENGSRLLAQITEVAADEDVDEYSDLTDTWTQRTFSWTRTEVVQLHSGIIRQDIVDPADIEPWSLTIVPNEEDEKAELVFSNCIFARGSVFKDLGPDPLSFELNEPTGPIFVGAKLLQADGSFVAFLYGPTLSDVADITLDEVSAHVKLPLYKLSSGGASWVKTLNLRATPGTKMWT